MNWPCLTPCPLPAPYPPSHLCFLLLPVVWGGSRPGYGITLATTIITLPVYSLGILNKLPMNVRFYFEIFRSIYSLIYMCIYAPVSKYFYYCRLIVITKIWKCETNNFLFYFSKIILVIAVGLIVPSKKICWNPNPYITSKNVTLFGDKALQIQSS